MAILTFNGRVNIAVQIVTTKYPKAVLFEANGKASTAPTTDPAKIDKLRVVFGIREEPMTIIIKETNYGEFVEPVVIRELWCGDVVIDWPIRMDLPEATELKEKSGYKEPYGAVTLRNPLGPTIGNPYFIFGDAKTQPYIFVDTVTGQVFKGN